MAIHKFQLIALAALLQPGIAFAQTAPTASIAEMAATPLVRPTSPNP